MFLEEAILADKSVTDEVKKPCSLYPPGVVAEVVVELLS